LYFDEECEKTQQKKKKKERKINIKTEKERQKVTITKNIFISFSLFIQNCRDLLSWVI
jgi:hypothetical protein